MSDGNGNVPRPQRRATVTCTVNIETGKLELTGACPSQEFAKMLFLAGADEVERRIHAQRVRDQLEIASPGIVADLQASRFRT